MPRTATLGLLLLLAGSASAQEFRATLQGTVTDPSQAAVPKATVILRNVDTSIERDTPSDDNGHYLIPFVAPGNYSVTISAPGFRTTVRNGVVLSANDN